MYYEENVLMKLNEQERENIYKEMENEFFKMQEEKNALENVLQ